MTPAKITEFFTLLKMVGFVDNTEYQARGDASVSYSFGRLMYKNGAPATSQGTGYQKRFLIDYLPEWCVAYAENGQFKLSVFSQKWGDDGIPVTHENVMPFITAAQLLMYVQELQKISHTKALMAMKKAQQEEPTIHSPVKQQYY
ncbi:hypothetical protein [Thalassomonas actiniarum]|uniref:Uncharacterized protein n=1 Tax=Thalassomonas actiniarum TaxID=485447 RepID=A0AAF0C5K9_9GAMM|nr:hypothetical protein [Thalassomonas actiniarum]WDE01109.1 hypothetical protein SG35_011005 [Thalassomonas actiniarum]